MRVQFETTITLPWLEPYDRIMAEVGFGGHIIKATAPPGSDIEYDAGRQIARILFPDGRVKAWSGDASLILDPSVPSWRVEWRMPGTLDEVALEFQPFEPLDDTIDRDVSHVMQINSDEFEGQEHRFADFVALLQDPLLNPHGFALGDGLYREASGEIKFEVSLAQPSFRARPETLPAELSFPFITDIGVPEPLTFTHHDRTVDVEPGYYRAKVYGFNVYSGEAHNIRCKPLGESTASPFDTNGDQLTRFIHQGAVEIMRIVKDRRPNY